MLKDEWWRSGEAAEMVRFMCGRDKDPFGMYKGFALFSTSAGWVMALLPNGDFASHETTRELLRWVDEWCEDHPRHSWRDG